mmetsp:Transcript_114772/g.203312  ORF Transcript_114772/g.203312 Transcript_114772/m.203312 type:complete len:202 (-) Transcript_114772:494-1099(-)
MANGSCRTAAVTTLRLDCNSTAAKRKASPSRLTAIITNSGSARQLLPANSRAPPRFCTALMTSSRLERSFWSAYLRAKGSWFTKQSMKSKLERALRTAACERICSEMPSKKHPLNLLCTATCKISLSKHSLAAYWTAIASCVTAASTTSRSDCSISEANRSARPAFRTTSNTTARSARACSEALPKTVQSFATATRMNSIS